MTKRVAIAALLTALGATAEAQAPARRWVYLMHNLQVDANVAVVEEILRRAAACGYNGAVLADYKFGILARVAPWYFRNVARVRETARRLGIELIPAVGPFGYSAAILSADPNLAEGLPVRGQSFVVRGGTAELESSFAGPLPGGDFEKSSRNRIAGWESQDEPGTLTFADTAIKHGGRSALRFERADGGKEYVNARVNQTVKVAPWRPYHVRLWAKAEGFEAAHDVRCFAMGDKGKVLSHSNLGVRRDQDWTAHDVVFNSLGNETVRLYVGVWGPRGGRLWVDDVSLEEIPFLNFVGRPTAPLRLTRGGEPLEPGKDFVPIKDERMHERAVAGGFEVHHAPPKLAVLPGGRLKDGDRIEASYFHAVAVHDDQVAASLADPGSKAWFANQVRRVNDLLEPKTWFLSHDEIRVANWENPPGTPAGPVLAANVAECVRAIRAVRPDAAVCVWSDMFDPHHNAVDDYYLVNGSLKGSWEGLAKDVTIVNWNSGKAAPSLRFFAERGHAQVLAGYYDHDPTAIRGWQRQGEGLRGIDGAMYTTWQNNYRDLEAFAASAWGGSAKRD